MGSHLLDAGENEANLKVTKRCYVFFGCSMLR